MKITIEFNKKEIGCVMEQTMVVLSETDMSSLDQVETMLEMSKAIEKSYKAKNDVCEVAWDNGKFELDISDKFFCKIIKKMVFIGIGLKSVIEAIVKMLKTWAANLVGTFSDLEEDMGETKVWIDGEEVTEECDDDETEDSDDDIPSDDDPDNTTNKDENEGEEPVSTEEIKTEFDC